MLRTLLVLVCFSLLISCGDNGVESLGNFYSIIENSDTYIFPAEGFYYSYNFEYYHQTIPDVEAHLTDFYDSGTKIEDAWYTPGRSECDSQDVIIYPKFIIRTLIRYERIIEDTTYTEVGLPIDFECTNALRHYILIR